MLPIAEQGVALRRTDRAWIQTIVLAAAVGIGVAGILRVQIAFVAPAVSYS